MTSNTVKPVGQWIGGGGPPRPGFGFFVGWAVVAT